MPFLPKTDILRADLIEKCPISVTPGFTENVMPKRIQLPFYLKKKKKKGLPATGEENYALWLFQLFIHYDLGYRATPMSFMSREFNGIDHDVGAIKDV